MKDVSRVSEVPLRAALLAFGAFAAVCAFSIACMLPAQAQAASPDYVWVGADTNLAAGGTVKAGSGTVTYAPATSTLTLDNATISTSRSGSGIYLSSINSASGSVKVVLKGSNKITGGNSTGDAFASYGFSLAFSGSGSLAIDSYGTGIYALGAGSPAVSISGGTFSVNTASYGIRSSGKLTISGGAVKINVKNASGYALYSTSSTVSNKVSALTVTGGLLGEGASFKKSGSTYKVTSAGYYVTLVSWGGGKKANLNTVSYAGTYRVRGIGANAFNTAKGKKVTKITLGMLVSSIGKNAFKNTKKLTNLNIKDWYAQLLYGNLSISKKAFKGCGKSSGKKLKVHTGSRYQNAKVKKKLVKKGLSKKAKVVK